MCTLKANNCTQRYSIWQVAITKQINKETNLITANSLKISLTAICYIHC
jgi:hypothetical protein